MELVLMKDDLWSVVKYPKPEGADITSAWNKKNEKARAAIGLAFGGQPIVPYYGCWERKGNVGKVKRLPRARFVV